MPGKLSRDLGIDFSIDHWWRRVPGQQWPHQAMRLAAIDEELSPLLKESRPLAEVHRLDLSLFVVFEEAALRVSGSLVRSAPKLEALNFAAQQTLDEAHHHEMFLRRSDASRALAGLPPGQIDSAILIPPLRRFLERCYEVADNHSFIEGLTLINLLLEGMVYPLYSYEERYWRSIDPYLARLIRGAFIDETRHVRFGAQLVNAMLADDPAERVRVARMCGEARRALREVFQYYVRIFVGMFDSVARTHREVFADAEISPGKRIAETPYAEQVALIYHSIDTEHEKLMTAAGLL